MGALSRRHRDGHSKYRHHRQAGHEPSYTKVEPQPHETGLSSFHLLPQKYKSAAAVPAAANVPSWIPAQISAGIRTRWPTNTNSCHRWQPGLAPSTTSHLPTPHARTPAPGSRQRARASGTSLLRHLLGGGAHRRGGSILCLSRVPAIDRRNNSTSTRTIGRRSIPWATSSVR